MHACIHAQQAITINANGDYSTNSFHVSGPQAINVNIGSSPGGEYSYVCVCVCCMYIFLRVAVYDISYDTT